METYIVVVLLLLLCVYAYKGVEYVYNGTECYDSTVYNGTECYGSSSTTVLAPLRTFTSSPREFKLGDTTKRNELQAKRVASARATAELADRHLKENQYINLYYNTFVELHKSFTEQLTDIMYIMSVDEHKPEMVAVYNELLVIHSDIINNTNIGNSKYNNYIRSPKNIALYNEVTDNVNIRNTIYGRLSKLKNDNSVLLADTVNFPYFISLFTLYFNTVTNFITVDNIVKRKVV